MTNAGTGAENDLFDEVPVRRANLSLRALWMLGVALIGLSVLGFSSAMTLYGPNGFSFGSGAPPAAYFIASLAQQVAAPLLIGGVLCIALALGVGALLTHLTSLAGERADELAGQAALQEPAREASVAPAVVSPVAEAPRVIDPRIFMRPSAGERH